MKKLSIITLSMLLLSTSYKVESSSPITDSKGNIIGWTGPATLPTDTSIFSDRKAHHGGVSRNKSKPIAKPTDSTPSDIMPPHHDVARSKNLERVKTISKEIPAFTNKEVIIHELVNTAKTIAPKMMLSFLTYSDIGSIFNNMENLNARLERIEKHLNLSV